MIPKNDPVLLKLIADFRTAKHEYKTSLLDPESAFTDACKAAERRYVQSAEEVAFYVSDQLHPATT